MVRKLNGLKQQKTKYNQKQEDIEYINNGLSKKKKNAKYRRNLKVCIAKTDKKRMVRK